MGERKRQSFLQGALILTMAAVLTKVIGALFFKIPLQRLSADATGLFATAYNIYVPIYTVCTAGFPIAVSRMVSESMTLGKFRDVRVIFRVSFKVFFLTGTVGTVLMLGAAFVYPSFVGMPGCRLTMLIMAPAILFCCLISAYRGVYEGSRNMIPTAVSQIVEAVGKLLLGLGLAAGAMQYGTWCFEQGRPVFGKVAETADEALTFTLPYVAGGAMVGVTAGSLLALLYIMIRYRRTGTGITRAELQSAPRPASSRTMFRRLLRFAIPVALGTLATQLTNLIDVVSLQKCLELVVRNNLDFIRGMYGFAEGIEKSQLIANLTGNRDIAITYVNLVPNITLTFGVSALPVITSAWAVRDKRQLRSMVSTVLRMTLLIALPAGIGMSVLSGPIIRMIYNSPGSMAISAPMLGILGWAVIFICLVAPINAMLQAMGRADIPAKIVLIGGAVKLLLNTTLVMNPHINIMGSAWSTLACYIVMVVLSLLALRRVMNMRLRWRAIFIKPLLAALLCGAAAWASDGLLGLVIPTKIATVLAILIAMIVYIMALFLLRAIDKDEIIMLPKGQKIAQILEKHGWIG